MKTFKQYLMEADLKSIRDILMDDCGEFLHDSGGNWLLRGIKNGEKDHRLYALDPDTDEEIEYSKRLVRQDRKPKDLSPAVHEVVDGWFKEKFGVRARSQSLFCFGTKGWRYAKEYGDVYMVFPIGGDFTCIWSPHVQDLYSDLPVAITNQWRDLEDGWEQTVRDWLDDQSYTNRGIDRAVEKSSHEIMVMVPSYYAIHNSFAQKMERIFEHD